MADHKSEPAIKTEGLTKIFRDFWGHKRVIAIDSLDLEVRRHEVYGLLGPNGSGKSTTVKILLGLLFPSRGSVSVLGFPPGEVKINAQIGYLPEESHLYPFLSARETLDFYGRLFGLGSGERKMRIDSLLEMVGLTSVGRRPIGEFSKGMARRIGLAQALINDPDLLILDEPTSGLDPIGTRQIKDLILQLGQRGKTVLLCSHLLADVEDVCDRIGILYGGKMQQEGMVNELLACRDMTQIRSPRLDNDLIEKIKEIISREHQDYDVEVDSPRDSLEEYFLKIVAQAQASEITTSGALMGAGISDFLGSTDQQKSSREVIINQLVSGRDIDLAKVDQDQTQMDLVSTQDVQTNEIQQEVLGDLLKSRTPGEMTTRIDPTEAAGLPANLSEHTSETEIDRSLLDMLISGNKNKNSDTSADDLGSSPGNNSENKP